MVKSPAPGQTTDPRYAVLNAIEQRGDPAEILDKIGAFRDAGVDGLWVTFMYQELPELIESLEWFAETVLTRL